MQIYAEGELVARFTPWSRRSSYIDSNVPSFLNFIEEYSALKGRGGGCTEKNLSTDSVLCNIINSFP